MKWYPELGDLRLIYRGVETLKKYNPRMVLDQFLYYVGPYYLEIFNKQEQFFTDLNNLMKDPNIQDVIKSESNNDETKIDKSYDDESNARATLPRVEPVTVTLVVAESVGVTQLAVSQTVIVAVPALWPVTVTTPFEAETDATVASLLIA